MMYSYNEGYLLGNKGHHDMAGNPFAEPKKPQMTWTKNTKKSYL